MKQHLKIKSFYGKSENAVYNQIWIALITYCLQVLLQLKFNHEGPLLELKRTLVKKLFKGLDNFIQSLFRKPSRTSEGRKKYNWEEDFRAIERQFNEGEVDNCYYETSYDPMFLTGWKSNESK